MRRVFAVIGMLAVAAAALVAMGAGEDAKEQYLVRAIFDNAAFVVEGEDVKVAGVRVGSIDKLDITRDNKAVVVLDIEDPAYQDFREDAACKIRPQSLIGEELVECTPTQPRSPGEEAPPELAKVPEGEEGEGQRLLPVENTGASVDLDLVNEVFRRPYAERLTIIINELGVGLAGRGSDLNDVIRRAAPALQETDKVLRLLARQNSTLKQLAKDSDTVMEPLARERKHVSSFIENSSEVAEATAERREELQANFAKLPGFLRELRPTMARLGSFADESIPVARDLRAGAPTINALLRNLAPFSRAATPAVEALGDVAEPGIPAIRASIPIVQDLRTLSREIRPVGAQLAAVLKSFRKNEGPERLMDYLYFQAMAINGFDSLGHFLRINLLVNTCSAYATTIVPGCESNFRKPTSGATASAARAATAFGAADKVLERTRKVLGGADPKDVLAADGITEEQIKAESEAILERLKGDATAPRPSRARGGSGSGSSGASSAEAPASAPVEPTGLLLDYLLGAGG